LQAEISGKKQHIRFFNLIPSVQAVGVGEDGETGQGLDLVFRKIWVISRKFLPEIRINSLKHYLYLSALNYPFFTFVNHVFET
jgi:hypothetical protein